MKKITCSAALAALLPSIAVASASGGQKAGPSPASVPVVHVAPYAAPTAATDSGPATAVIKIAPYRPAAAAALDVEAPPASELAADPGETVVASAPAKQDVAVFKLRRGESIQAQIEGWAKASGWTLVWNAPNGWLAPGDISLPGDFEKAVTSVVSTLAANGADIQSDTWVGLDSKTIVVHPSGSDK
ncbi:toxin co-regulated pilus biosynthesis Q family protein [Burkholderia cenocepacia]|uniref:toxin co-regulated pilus biosynthesis Q family protein n=1 Tax=Burkholderia cenocepacia TaxID=95486 RepID=UPI00223169A1|nr:toxin co-regulated pilus biosynthesis Q family protein [Burkholderia cenocepacia]MCW3677835.1 toxin co-regulated pilus biosynthesis Q family protein [Burkholderia cenocepacia]